MWQAITFIIFFLSSTAFASEHPEKYYQKAWCDEQGGVTEYVLDDKTRVDCLLDEYAVEFDFAKKWAESIGQALYYAIKTNRKPAVVLIMEESDKDIKYLNRLKAVAEKYHIKIWTISPHKQ